MNKFSFALLALCLMVFVVPAYTQDTVPVELIEPAETTEPVEPQKAPELVEGNVWTTEDGTHYYHCPVMGGEGKVAGAKAFSVIDGVKYYHCCSSCQGPFRSNPEKWLNALALPANVISVDDDGLRTFRDPVDGKEQQVKRETHFTDLDGKRYFFASKKTMKTFEENPQKYLN